MKESEITRTIRRQNRWKAFSAILVFLFSLGMLLTVFKLNGEIDWRLAFSAGMACFVGAMFAWFMGTAQRHDILVQARGMSTHQLDDYIRQLRSVHRALCEEEMQRAEFTPGNQE